MKTLLTTLILIFTQAATFAQESYVAAQQSKYEWHNFDDIDSHTESALRFSANSPSIMIRYSLEKEAKQSRIALSITDSEGYTKMLSGDFELIGEEYIGCFREGINYSKPALKRGGYEFSIWMATPHKIKRLEVGVEGGSFFGFSQCREESPIVVIDMASRGEVVATESLCVALSCAMDRRVCGVATFEEAAKIDAKAYVVRGETKNMIKGAKLLRKASQSTPIIVGSKSLMSRLQRDAVGDIHLVESANDWLAYETTLREVLNCCMGEISTMRAISQRRVPSHQWSNQCQYIIRDIKTSQPKCAIIGNSIVHNWGGNPAFEQRLLNVEGQDSWLKYMGNFVNMGIGSDRIENLLWRVYNDQMEIKEFEDIIIMIGTNNLKNSTLDDIVAGVENLVEQIKIRQKSAQITLVGILPRKDIAWTEIQKINKEYEKIAERQGVEYMDLGHLFLDENDIPLDELFRKNDVVHPSAKGYEVMGKTFAERSKR